MRKICYIRRNELGGWFSAVFLSPTFDDHECTYAHYVCMVECNQKYNKSHLSANHAC